MSGSIYFFWKCPNNTIDTAIVGWLNRNIASKLCCNWDCGFEDWDIQKVVDYENVVHISKAQE